MEHPKANTLKPSREWLTILECKPEEPKLYKPYFSFFASPQSMIQLEIPQNGDLIQYRNMSGHERKVTIQIKDL